MLVAAWLLVQVLKNFATDAKLKKAALDQVSSRQ